MCFKADVPLIIKLNSQSVCIISACHKSSGVKLKYVSINVLNATRRMKHISTMSKNFEESFKWSFFRGSSFMILCQ